jgi:hypothetical protein
MLILASGLGMGASLNLNLQGSEVRGSDEGPSFGNSSADSCHCKHGRISFTELCDSLRSMYFSAYVTKENSFLAS